MNARTGGGVGKGPRKEGEEVCGSAAVHDQRGGGDATTGPYTTRQGGNVTTKPRKRGTGGGVRKLERTRPDEDRTRQRGHTERETMRQRKGDEGRQRRSATRVKGRRNGSRKEKAGE